MGRIEKTIFISYRRTNMPWALAIYQNLTMHGYDVFFDYDSIPSGDFEQVILGNIRARAHFLVVLTPSALERCVNPDDWLRREIETALDEKRNIIPVFLEGFDFGSPSISAYLTGKLVNLKKYNGQNVPAGFFEEAMKRVRDNFLNVSLDAVIHPVSATVQKVVQDQQAAADAATSVKEKELTAQEWFEKGYKALDSHEKIHCYTASIRLKPDYTDAYYNRGLAHFNKGDLDYAIKDYTEAIRLKPDYTGAYYNRGLAYYNKGELNAAIKDYTEAIRIKPDYANAYVNRGVTRKLQDDLDGAIKDYTEAIRFDKENADAFNNRGTARHAKNDMTGAIEDYSEAIRLKPDYADAYYNRGIARSNTGDMEGAIKDYTEAIRLKSNYPDAYYNRGLAHYSKGDLDIAIKDFTDAIRFKPDYAEGYISRGVARAAKGDVDGAIGDYTEAIRLKPISSLAYRNRGAAWDNKGDYYSAIADFEKSIELGDKEPTVPPRMQYLRGLIK